MLKNKKFILRLLILIALSFIVLHINVALGANIEPTEPIKEVEVIDTRTMPIKEYAMYRVDDIFVEGQSEYFDELVIRESSWKPYAQNPNSTAFGIGQFLDATWETVKCEKTTNPHKQIDCMIKYVDARYATPEKALEFHTENNYY
jgi:hypothetical protein